MKKLVSIIIIGFLFFNLYSQNHFVKSFDTYTHSIYGMCKINSTTLALTGKANDSASGNWDFILIKTDLNGNILFSKKYNDSLFSDEAYDIISVSDGGFLLTVVSDSIGGAFNPYPEIVRIDSSGNLIWGKKFITSKNSELLSSIECLNGDFAFAGYQDGVLGTEAILLLTNHSGDTLWSRKLGSPGFGTEVFRDILETEDNNLLVLGNTPLGAGAGDLLVAKYTMQGDTIWTRTYGTSGQDYGNSVLKASNGSFYLSGFTYFPSTNKKGSFIIKIDSTGSIIWSTIIGTNYGSTIYKTIELPNKDLLLSGTVKTINGGVSDGLIAITDSLGVLKSAVSYGGLPYEELRDITIMNDSTCISSGSIIDNTISLSKTILVRQNTNNLNSCFGSNILLNDTLVAFQEGHGLSTYENSFQIAPKIFTTVNMQLVDLTICADSALTNFELAPVNDQIRIYPNPFTSQTCVLFSKEMKNSTVKIIDVFGKEIYGIDFTGKQLLIERNTLKEGIYFLQIVDDNKNVVTRKIEVVQ